MIIDQIKSIHTQGIMTPFYFFDRKGFIDNYNEITEVFRKEYNKYVLSYSYKTNYTPYICDIVKSKGGYAEVVSDMEYDLAKKIGYENDKIIYNGPAKGIRLEEHMAQNGITNIDNYDEAVRICKFANNNLGKQFSVGLRINLDLGGFISRFGFELKSKDLKETLVLLKKQKNINIVGLHCHISRARSIAAWKKRVEIMLKAADELITGVPRYISLGSGMFAAMEDELKKQFEVPVPSYSEYAKEVLKPFAEHYKNYSRDLQPILFTEPGTTIVARYIFFVTKVLNLKEIKGRKIATVDGSYLNLGEICTMKSLPVDILRNNELVLDNGTATDIMGFTCLEQDLMKEKCERSILKGDIIIFHNCGGYSIVLKPQFIRPNCAMYSIDENDKLIQIMREENFNDVFNKFIFN